MVRWTRRTRAVVASRKARSFAAIVLKARASSPSSSREGTGTSRSSAPSPSATADAVRALIGPSSERLRRKDR